MKPLGKDFCLIIFLVDATYNIDVSCIMVLNQTKKFRKNFYRYKSNLLEN